MKKKALIYSGKVVQVAAESFPVHEFLTWVDCPSECRPGWGYESGECFPPDPPPATPEELRAEAELLRRRAYQEQSDPVILAAMTDGGDLEIAKLEAAAIKAEIRARYPYPTE